MKTRSLLFVLFAFLCLSRGFSQDAIVFRSAKFNTGNQENWKEITFDDSQWSNLKTNEAWDSQGYADYDGFAWSRFRFNLPSSLLKNSFWKDSLVLYLGKIDDADEVYFNGQLIGKTGRFPGDAEGYLSLHSRERYYKMPADAPYLRWNKENLIAVKVFDANMLGGMYAGVPYLRMVDLINEINIHHSFSFESARQECTVRLTNGCEQTIKGLLVLKITDAENGKIVKTYKFDANISASAPFEAIVPFSMDKRYRIDILYTDRKTNKSLTKSIVAPYILTPKASDSPAINGAKVFGVRPGAPFLFKIPASGLKPMKYAVDNLPTGLDLDAETGIITGVLDKPGEYLVTLRAENSVGLATREFAIKVGDKLALTPPMGWNSWNCWGLSVSDKKVRSSAQALIDQGLIDYGWSYINIDDAWENEAREEDGTLTSNSKFPDMKALGDWLHAVGLRFGVYSSPGPLTCGGYLGSYSFEKNDAKTYAGWGVDFLKYDWCDYGQIFQKEEDFSDYAFRKPYQVMGKALREQKRDIVYSLCQYGMNDVSKWGSDVDGNQWRTTGDIVDTWKSLKEIGFDKQAELHPYSRPGAWNDPDMLIVGKVGWGENLHYTRLTPDEQYTHISLWCLLASPLLIGCDISQMDAFTLSLLTNSEVIAVNQDTLGKQAQRVYNKDDEQVWVKELEDGSKAIGIFNLSDEDKTITVRWKDLGLKDSCHVRDLWRQKDMDASMSEYKVNVAPHGVNLIRFY